MKRIYKDTALETKGHYLVGLELQRFLGEFLPWNTSTCNFYRNKVSSKQRLNNLRRVAPEPGETESVMYKPFVEALDQWITESALRSAKVPNPQTLRFLNTNKPDTTCESLNSDISTYWEDLTDRTIFSRQQTHEDFKHNIGHDAFQHVSSEGPNDSKEEIADDGDELDDVDEGEEKEAEEAEEADPLAEEEEREGDQGDQADANVEVDLGDINNNLLKSREKKAPG